jgi:phosphomannomutase
VRVDELDEIDEMMRYIRANPPRRLLDAGVGEVSDMLPDADVLTLRTDAARVVVRPSGTEPKLKAYLQFVEPVTGGDVTAARTRAAAALARLRDEVGAALGR